MRVLSPQEFLKKVTNTLSKPSIEVLPNWQLRLTIPEGVELRRHFGPDPREISNEAYIVFLSELDILAKSSFAVSYSQDTMQS